MDLQQLNETVQHAMGDAVSKEVAARAVAFIAEHSFAQTEPGPTLRELDDEELSLRLSDALGLSPGHAVELYHTVCRLLDHALDDEARRAFHRALPPEVAETFHRSRAVPAMAPDTGHRLADGRPGSTHSLADGRLAQSDSLVAEDSPKSDIKLSSTRGLTQEREHHTLADGKPGSTRPISDEH